MMTKIPVLDMGQLDSLRELNEPGDKDIVSELIHIFFEQSPQTIQNLKKSVAEKNALHIEKHAHKLKGSCANLGAEIMREFCREMEDCGRNKNLARVETLMNDIEKSYAEASIALKNEIKKFG